MEVSKMTKLGILLVSLLAFGCGDNDDDDIIIDDGTGDTGDGDDTGTPPPNAREWVANLVALEPGYTLSGTSIVTAFPGEPAFTASIQLEGDVPGSLRPWHVHVGTCGSGGSIVGPDAAYPRLSINNDGFAVVETNVLVALDNGAYHVNVHFSDAQFDRLIACGDLIRQ
jgi:hypothetical protein